MLREKARDNSGHWVIEEALGSEVEEGSLLDKFVEKSH